MDNANGCSKTRVCFSITRMRHFPTLQIWTVVLCPAQWMKSFFWSIAWNSFQQFQVWNIWVYSTGKCRQKIAKIRVERYFRLGIYLEVTDSPYHVYILESFRVVHSRNVTFDESKFPGAKNPYKQNDDFFSCRKAEVTSQSSDAYMKEVI